MSGEEDVCSPTLKPQHEMWEQEVERHYTQVDELQARAMEVKASIEGSTDDRQQELEVLRQTVKRTATLLAYLKTVGRSMDLARKSCDTNQLEGVGIVIDRDGTPLAWPKALDLLSSNSLDEETSNGNNQQPGSLDKQNEAYISKMLESVEMVTDVMKLLVKRVELAESETVIQKEKVSLGQETIKLKVIEIENMSLRLEEMERFAHGTNGILNDMRQRVESLVDETTRQRERAAENEQELSRVKSDFESLKSYVSSLISVRETLLSSEKQFQTIERLFERLVVKTTQLEVEKTQKEAEVQKLMEENVKLAALLDKKEAQLVAMNEQCKVMALSASNI